MGDGRTFAPINPNAGYTAIFGDGTTLYTAPCFGPSPFLVSSDSDGETWEAQSEQTFLQGPFEMAFDAANGIAYSASWSPSMFA